MSDDPYCHPGTDILLNKLGLRDADRLRAAERDLTTSRAAEALAFADQASRLDQATWRGIHRILFQDVYDWAGEHRTVDIAKAGWPFAPVRALADYADHHILPAFERATRTRNPAQFPAALAECWGELNALHPFREGNGRATQIFVTALARRHGHDIDWARVERAEEIAAAVASHHRDYGPYRALLSKALTTWPPAVERQQAGDADGGRDKKKERARGRGGGLL